MHERIVRMTEVAALTDGVAELPRHDTAWTEALTEARSASPP